MKNRTPSDRSVYLTSRLMPGAETLSSFAAPVIVPEIITARITSICRSVIMGAGSLVSDRSIQDRSRDETRGSVVSRQAPPALPDGQNTRIPVQPLQ